MTHKETHWEKKQPPGGNTLNFDIRDSINFNQSGRAACPSCIQDGKTKQTNLSCNMTTGAFMCWRGCSSKQIIQALGHSKQASTYNSFKSERSEAKRKFSNIIMYTVSEQQVQQAQNLLLKPQDAHQKEALDWLHGRGFTPEMLRYYQLGLERKWFCPDTSKPNLKEAYWAICIYIPSKEPGQFYGKYRIAPWLTGTERPDYLTMWTQRGLSTTVWYTYKPEDAKETWFCEGEWDAMRLGWLAKLQEKKVAVCCSTSGCNTVPPKEQLESLPGKVVIFFDRNDEPMKNGLVPGDEGAKKLAFALNGRGYIACVPMPDGCVTKGWDVSNALDAGYTWEAFEEAAKEATLLSAKKLEDSVESSLRDRIIDILERCETQADRDLALISLSKSTKYNSWELEKLASSFLAELDLNLDRVEAAHKLQSLLTTRQTHLDVSRYLEPWFATALLETAKAMPTAPEYLFTTLVPAAASRIGTSSQVIIKASAGYTQPMVFWTAIVANSGSMKTPSQRAIIDPLVELEQEAFEAYKSDLADYNAAVELRKSKRNGEENEPNPRSPIRKRYLTKDSTLETLQRIHAENPRGLLYYRDELAGVVKGRNQYRGGRGADEEAELDQWVGSSVIVDRGDKSICLPQSSISRTGAIQWEVLGTLMGDHQDSNGAWSRWIFSAPSAPPRYLNLTEDEQDLQLAKALKYLYVELEKLPSKDYILSLEAKRLFEAWQHQLVDAQCSEVSSGLQLVYPKIEAYTARFALWLHIVNAVLRGEPPSTAIDGHEMRQAIELAAYYLWQHRLIHIHNSPDSGLVGLGLKIQRYAERSGAVTASSLKAGIRALKKTPVEQIRKSMQALADAGWGHITGEGSQMSYTAIAMDGSLLSLPSRTAHLSEIDEIDKQLTPKPTAGRATLNAPQQITKEIDIIVAPEDLVERTQTTIQYETEPESPLINNQVEQKPDLFHRDEQENRSSIETTKDAQIEEGHIGFEVGDRCEYTGTALRQLKGLNQLQIEAIEGESATVRSRDWYVSQIVPISELRKHI